MFTGIVLILLGVLILWYPQLLTIFFALLLILIGLTTDAAGYQFRRMKRSSGSRYVNWIARW